LPEDIDFAGGTTLALGFESAKATDGGGGRRRPEGMLPVRNFEKLRRMR
jgi:hypothetical protein